MKIMSISKSFLHCAVVLGCLSQSVAFSYDLHADPTDPMKLSVKELRKPAQTTEELAEAAAKDAKLVRENFMVAMMALKKVLGDMGPQVQSFIDQAHEVKSSRQAADNLDELIESFIVAAKLVEHTELDDHLETIYCYEDISKRQAAIRAFEGRLAKYGAIDKQQILALTNEYKSCE